MTTRRLTLETFEIGMKGMCLNYGRKLDKSDPDDKALMTLFWRALSPYSDEAVGRAFVEVVRRCKWFPRVADLVEIMEPPRQNAAKAAWAEVLGMLHSYGGLHNQYWQTDAATEEAVWGLGGWGHLATRSIPYELSKDSFANAFCALYERAQAKGLDLKPGRVIGLRDQNLATGGYLPLTEIRPQVGSAIGYDSAPALPDHQKPDDYTSLDLPAETVKRFSSMAEAKRLN